MAADLLTLLNKYDVPTPRYTSYPTVPYWEDDSFSRAGWMQSVKDSFKENNREVCLYIHLPFCESLCTFCGCNKRITKNHGVEDPYIKTLLKEWSLYLNELGDKPVIREIHLGGGTPTFFSPDNLDYLLSEILNSSEIAEEHEFSVEVHPNHTTEAHLETLAKLGFNRISIGVQDFDPTVQFIINRMQTFETTYEVVQQARKHGYTSVNIDLVYGLPKQDLACVKNTIRLLEKIMPERIAFYSYAHVPWKSKGQRRYTEADLPKAEDKWEMYEKGREMLTQMGFEAIAMDHFALPQDELFKASDKGVLNRNFMGYTTTQSKLIIGIGASSISDTWGYFAQNIKEIEPYQEEVEKGNIPVFKGHELTEEDKILRRHILDLMCRYETTLSPEVNDTQFLQDVFSKLTALADDGLVEVNNRHIKVTDKGKTFIRNIAATIDARLWRKKAEGNLFSKSV